jgi:hypothetical protein
MNRDLNLARWPGNMVWVRRISAEEGKGSLERGRGGALTSEPPFDLLGFYAARDDLHVAFKISCLILPFFGLLGKLTTNSLWVFYMDALQNLSRTQICGTRNSSIDPPPLRKESSQSLALDTSAIQSPLHVHIFYVVSIF